MERSDANSSKEFTDILGAGLSGKAWLGEAGGAMQTLDSGVVVGTWLLVVCELLSTLLVLLTTGATDSVVASDFDSIEGERDSVEGIAPENLLIYAWINELLSCYQTAKM